MDLNQNFIGSESAEDGDESVDYGDPDCVCCGAKRESATDCEKLPPHAAFTFIIKYLENKTKHGLQHLIFDGSEENFNKTLIGLFLVYLNQEGSEIVLEDINIIRDLTNQRENLDKMQCDRQAAINAFQFPLGAPITRNMDIQASKLVADFTEIWANAVAYQNGRICRAESQFGALRCRGGPLDKFVTTQGNGQAYLKGDSLGQKPFYYCKPTDCFGTGHTGRGGDRTHSGEMNSASVFKKITIAGPSNAVRPTTHDFLRLGDKLALQRNPRYHSILSLDSILSRASLFPKFVTLSKSICVVCDFVVVDKGTKCTAESNVLIASPLKYYPWLGVGFFSPSFRVALRAEDNVCFECVTKAKFAIEKEVNSANAVLFPSIGVEGHLPPLTAPSSSTSSSSSFCKYFDTTSPS